MRKFLFVFIFAILAACIYFGLRSNKDDTQEVIVHDTVYKDTMYLTVHDTVYYDAKWLRKKFETAEWKIWKNYWDGVPFRADIGCLSSAGLRGEL